jgi:hypothetical protein
MKSYLGFLNNPKQYKMTKFLPKFTSKVPKLRHGQKFTSWIPLPSSWAAVFRFRGKSKRDTTAYSKRPHTLCRNVAVVIVGVIELKVGAHGRLLL